MCVVELRLIAHTVSVIQHRLDQLSEVGLPLWITELDISEPDSETKADLLENVMRIYFSHPAVEGVILWGFWDQRHWRPEAAIATGNDVKVSGEAYLVYKLNCASSTLQINRNTR